MNLQKLILTKNDCYKANKQITVKGIMVHSTGANNPNLKRYVGPDDGKLGKNLFGNHWNTATPGGSKICVHAFIGKLKDGTIATYQTLPWNHRGWHSGSGSKGSANDTHIGFEICEDGLNDASYFNKVYKEAVELCAYLCKQYKLTEKNIICHSEGYKQGIASNHGDVMHWFPKHGKSMDTLRADVKKLLNNPAEEISTGYITYTVKKGDSLWKIAATYLGNGSKYPEIATLNNIKNNFIYAGQTLKIPSKTAATAPKKSVEEIAKEVIKGKWGNGADRKKRLTDAGYNYAEVQAKVNQLLK
jgi:LysM repeat protein